MSLIPSSDVEFICLTLMFSPEHVHARVEGAVYPKNIVEVAGKDFKFDGVLPSTILHADLINAVNAANFRAQYYHPKRRGCKWHLMEFDAYLGENTYGMKDCSIELRGWNDSSKRLH